jgi:tetratricopeptide (TPR) repeat protein
LLIRGEALVADAAKGDGARTSIQAAGSLFRAVAPQDPLYVVALSDLGGLFLERSEFALSANYYRQAILVGEPNTQLQGNILAATSGLAVALKDLGDFRGAAAAFENGASIAAHTYGRDSNKYWIIASDWARFQYERGDRKAALIAFETLLQSLPRERDGFRNASDALEAVEVLHKYGRCLATDGQGTRAIQLLERAQALLMTSVSHVSDATRLQLDLAKAYEAAGRIADARAAFVEVLKAFEAHQAPASQLASASERWGRFLLAQKDINGARKEFLETLRLSAGHVSEAALYAQVGLANIGVSSGDARAALETSGRAMEQLNHLEGSYDIRIQPYVWTVRARSLLLTGDVEGARSLAKRALEAERLYYAPNNKATSEAGALLQTLASNTTSQR